MTEVPAEWRAETTPEELKARRERWAADLESGLYEQGKQRLKTASIPDGPGQYCCLGVACDRYQKETGQGVWRHDELSNQTVFDPGVSGEERWSALPSPVAEWYGVSTDPQVGVYGEREPLSYHNDEHGASFEDIAKLIRRDL